MAAGIKANVNAPDVHRTELEWTYEPTDFFEAPYNHATPDFELKIDRGTATATIPTDTMPADLQGRVRSFVEGLFLARKLQLYRDYKLGGLRIRHSAGQKNVTLEIASSFHAHAAIGLLDSTVNDAAGNLVSDSKAERIAADTSQLEFLAPKIQQSAMLRELFEHYSRAVDDPGDEFKHLYDVRDALIRHYGGKLARRVLGDTDLERFRVLTCALPLEQSRHRGAHSPGLRSATNEELDEARNIARQWIIAFAQTL